MYNKITKDVLFDDWFEEYFKLQGKEESQRDYDLRRAREQGRFGVIQWISGYLDSADKQSNGAVYVSKLWKLFYEPNLEVDDESLIALKKTLEVLKNDDENILEFIKTRVHSIFRERSGLLGKPSKDVLLIILRKTTLPAVFSLSLVNHYLNRLVQPFIDTLKEEDQQRKQLEELVKFIPSWITRQNSPNESQALIEQNVKAAKALLKANAKKSYCLLFKEGPLASRGQSPLYLAVTRADGIMHKMLRTFLPEKNKKLNMAIVMLQGWVTIGHCSHVETILAKNSNLLTAKSPLLRWDNTPWYIVGHNRYREMFDLMVKHIPEHVGELAQDVCELLFLVTGGQQEEAEKLAKEKPSRIITKGIDGLSPIQIAAAQYDNDMLQMLVNHLDKKDWPLAYEQIDEVDSNNWHCDLLKPRDAVDRFIMAYPDLRRRNDIEINRKWLDIGFEYRLSPQHFVAKNCMPLALDKPNMLAKWVIAKGWNDPSLRRNCRISWPSGKEYEIFQKGRSTKDGIGLGFMFSIGSGKDMLVHLSTAPQGYHVISCLQRDYDRLTFFDKKSRSAVANIKKALKQDPEAAQDVVLPDDGASSNPMGCRMF